MELENLISDHAVLAALIKEQRVFGKKIVLTSGTFDLFHIGHARYLRAVKLQDLGTVLVVGVDSDEKVQKRKGPHRPIVPQDERVEIVCHTKYADYVTIKNINDGKWALIKLIRPDILILSERTSQNNNELEELKRYCGKIVILKSQASTSISAKIRLLIITFSTKVKDNLNELFEDIAGRIEQIKKAVDQFAGDI